jgi:hypothetical protein
LSGLNEGNSIGTASATTKVVSEFNTTAYAIKFVAGAFAAVSAIVGINEAAKISPALTTVGYYWLKATEYVWRQPADLVGVPFYPETAAVMTCYMSLMAIAFSALWLEGKHVARAQKPSVKTLAEFRHEWHSRVAQSIISGSIATAVLVAAIEFAVFHNPPTFIFAHVPGWYWAMHVLSILFIPVVVWFFGLRRLFSLLAIGVLCGALFVTLSLPSAVKAAASGVEAQNFYRDAYLNYAIARLPY